MTNEDYKAIEEVLGGLDGLLDARVIPEEHYSDVLGLTIILAKLLSGRVIF